MTAAAMGWAFQQDVGWPLAKLLLIRIGDECTPGTEELKYALDDLADFTGAHGRGEIVAALEYLAARELVHVNWYAPPHRVPEIPVGVRTCDPECGLHETAPSPRALTPLEIARREWNRLKSVLMPQVYERDGALCRACGATENLSGDHVIPLRHGGTNALPNLQVLCRPCNSRKWAHIESSS